VFLSPSKSFLLPILAVLALALAVSAQDADSNRPGVQSNPDDRPKSIREMMQKMRIDQEKKDYQEMIDRGEEALKISEQLEQSFSQGSTLSRSDREKLDALEKLVKKIRGELGGENDDDEPEIGEQAPQPKTPADGLKALQNLTGKMLEELKKTSRFGISAVAIQSSNAVLKVVRFLRFSK
jgi:hypothetical protein